MPEPTKAGRSLLWAAAAGMGVTASVVPAVAVAVVVAGWVTLAALWLHHLGFLRGWLDVHPGRHAPEVRPPRLP